jgi:aldose 1-epimerase
MHKTYIIIFFAIFLFSCKSETKSVPKEVLAVSQVQKITPVIYGTLSDSQKIELYTLSNSNNVSCKIINFGGIITEINIPDKSGKIQNITLGYDNIQDYEKPNPNFGALIGRYGNRIAKGKFAIDNEEYTLPLNDKTNSLHGGTKGFNKVVWKVEKAEKKDSVSQLTLSYISADMEMGYPGELKVTVTYSLNNKNELGINYQATTNKKTIVNLTHHAYFNLSGDFSKTILDHEVQINATKYLPVDKTLIPTGEFAEVKNTPFDFTLKKAIGNEINVKHDQIIKGLGYDHCWIIDGAGMRTVANVHHIPSGRTMEVMSDEPGLQFYTGNFLNGTLPNPQGGRYQHRTGFCMETQHFPDSPNQKNFPNVILEPGKTFNSNTIYKFSIL